MWRNTRPPSEKLHLALALSQLPADAPLDAQLTNNITDTTRLLHESEPLMCDWWACGLSRHVWLNTVDERRPSEWFKHTPPTRRVMSKTVSFSKNNMLFNKISRGSSTVFYTVFGLIWDLNSLKTSEWPTTTHRGGRVEQWSDVYRNTQVLTVKEKNLLKADHSEMDHGSRQTSAGTPK